MLILGRGSWPAHGHRLPAHYTAQRSAPGELGRLPRLHRWSARAGWREVGEPRWNGASYRMTRLAGTKCWSKNRKGNTGNAIARSLSERRRYELGTSRPSIGADADEPTSSARSESLGAGGRIGIDAARRAFGSTDLTKKRSSDVGRTRVEQIAQDSARAGQIRRTPRFATSPSQMALGIGVNTRCSARSTR